MTLEHLKMSSYFMMVRYRAWRLMVRYRAWRLKEKHIRFQSQNAPAEAKGPEVRIVGKGGTKGKARVFAQLQQNLCLGVGTFDTSG